MANISVYTVAADGLAPSGARASADRVMNKLGTHICMGLALKGLMKG